MGSGGVLAKLSELIFIEVSRRYAETLPADGGGWLTGLRDSGVGRAVLCSQFAGGASGASRAPAPTLDEEFDSRDLGDAKALLDALA